MEEAGEVAWQPSPNLTNPTESPRAVHGQNQEETGWAGTAPLLDPAPRGRPSGLACWTQRREVPRQRGWSRPQKEGGWAQDRLGCAGHR